MILSTLLTLAQAAPVAPKAPDQGMQMVVMMGFAFAMIYFLTIRPQQKKQRELAEKISATKTGDKVVTSGGIHGIITNVKEKTFLLKIAENVKIEIDKSAVMTVLKSSDDSGSESPAA